MPQILQTSDKIDPRKGLIVCCVLCVSEIHHKPTNEYLLHLNSKIVERDVVVLRKGKAFRRKGHIV